MTQYISKADVVAEIERRIKEIRIGLMQGLLHGYERAYATAQYSAFNSLITFLDILEVKEVDLDRDIRTYLTNRFNIYEDGVLQSKKSGLPLSTYDIIKVAKHFFELGLKTQKGE